MNKKNSLNLTKRIGVLTLLFSMTLPVVSLAGSKDIYVDIKASGKEDGSSKNPFNTIEEALKEAKKTKRKVEIHVANGIYRENIEVPNEVKLFGEDKKKTIIDAKDKEPAVRLKHKTEINKFTIKGGEYGVVISDGDRASVVECVIKENKKDGVKIRTASVDDKYMASVADNEIYNNGRSGIYAEKRRVSFVDNFIYENDGDGIDISAGSQAWVEGNKIKKNDKSGMKLTLDGSYIWTKNNTFYENEREGLEVNAYGGSGRIDINKSKFYKNEKWGIVKVERGSFNNSIWNGLTIQEDVIFWENKAGNIK